MRCGLIEAITRCGICSPPSCPRDFRLEDRSRRMSRKFNELIRQHGSGLPPGSRSVSAGPNPLVAQAVALCERGRVHEAEALTRGILSLAPRDHAALHMLGMIARQKGDHVRAVDFFRQAIAINGRVAAYHRNLGDAYLETRRFSEAASSFRRLLGLEPDSAPGRFGLGLALLGQKVYPAAAKELEAAAKARPDDSAAHLNLGIALTELGRFDEAIVHFRRAVALQPGYAGNHLKLAVALRATGEFREAHANVMRAIELDPELADAHFQLGIACRALGRPDDAVRAFGEALSFRPDMVEALAQLGGILYDLEQFEEAIGCYERALALVPRSAPLHRAVGRARFLQRRFGDARAAFARALDLEPENGENFAKIGRSYQAEGRFEEATTWYEKAIGRQPDNAEAHYSLATMRSSANREARVRALERTLALDALDKDQRAPLILALAKMYDEDGNYDAAFRCFRAGNDLRKNRDPYRPEEFSAMVDRQIAAFGKELFAEKGGIGSGSERPVFVVGMPRSGTTLVEQILASHPQVHGHGELGYVGEIVRSLPERLGANAPYPECVSALDAATARDLAETHLAGLKRDAGEAVHSIDKLPHNFEHLGLIALLFPGARVIHCIRDPFDTCLSCYFQDFGARHAYTRDLETLGRHYREYQRLMAHWNTTLPIRFLNVEYEALVGDQEVWSRKLIDFLGLAWDQRCLAFFETERPVLTASAWQVRQPIYTSSIGRWRNYAKHLGPLFGGLGVPPPVN